MLKKCDYCNTRIRPTLEKLHLRKCINYRRALKSSLINPKLQGKSAVKIEQVKSPPLAISGKKVPITVTTREPSKSGASKNVKR